MNINQKEIWNRLKWVIKWCVICFVIAPILIIAFITIVIAILMFIAYFYTLPI